MQSPDARPSFKLPVFGSRFIGRERETADLQRLLGRSRLVTLTGPAGTGKTRLALEVGRQLEAKRPDGPYLIELAGLTEGGLLPETFVAALGILQAQARQPVDTLLDWLFENDGLIIVDNCEHLIEACAALIDQILRRCRRVTVLATSREPLHIDGEVVWPVPALSLPPDRAQLAAIDRSEAVLLFVERARQASPGFALTRDNAAEVASICRRLDGLPLALELAAARAAVVDVASIAEQLNDRFRFLTTGFRTASPRHRTLRAAIDWSYELLTIAERQLLARASVFAGGFDLAAAEAVCVGGSVLRDHVLQVLGRLIEKSLLARVGTESERRRYRLLESIRAYGLDRLRESDEYEQIRRRHAEHFASAWNVGSEARDAEWLQIRLEVDNLREALAWSRSVDPDLHLRLAVRFGIYSMSAGLTSEGRAWLEPSLTTAAHEGPALVRGYEMAALLAWRQGDHDAADRLASASVTLARSLGDEVELGTQLGTLAFILIGALQFDRVPRTVEEMQAIARRLGDRGMEGAALSYLGLLEAHGDDAVSARDFLSRGAELFEAAGEPDATGMNYNVLGWMNLRLNDLPRARAAIVKGIAVRMRRRDVADMVSSLDSSAELAFMEGAPHHAMRLIGAADAIRETHGSVPPSLAVASRSRWMPGAEKFLGKRWRAVWLEGRRLTLDEAIRYALSPPGQAPPRAVREGEPVLSSREMELAELVAGGMTNDEIAARLKLSRRTVEAHLEHIRNKLRVRSRVEIAAWLTSRSLPQPTSRS